MSEAIYNKVQLGREATIGTAVAATVVFPVDAGFLGFELDRASESPDEDFGRSSREQAGRGSTGVRAATASMPFVMRYQDFMHILEMHAHDSVSPTGTNPYTYVYTFDETSDTLKTYTVQYGDENSTQDEHRAVATICTSLDYGFDALSSPGNMMWTGTAGLVAWTREQSAMTGSLSAPATLETMEGHKTTLAYGATSTAFGSLTALTAHLKSIRFTSDLNAQARAYGGTTDTPTAWGRSGKGEIGFEALIKISATSQTNVEDLFHVSGDIPTENRWRIVVTGAGGSCTFDQRVRYTTVDLGEHEGERLYKANGSCIYDSTLVGRQQITLVNAIASVP